MKNQTEDRNDNVEHILSKAIEEYGTEDVLWTLRMLGVHELQLNQSRGPGLEFYAVTKTLKQCNKQEIGEAKDKSKISVQVSFGSRRGRISDKIDLVDENNNVIYSWKWHGPKANDGATWTGEWKGKIYLHFKGRDNVQDVKYDLKVLS